MAMTQALVGVGGNMGDALGTCRRAVEALKEHPRTEVLRVSSFYRTKPVGTIPQPWFVNAVVLCETQSGPDELTAILRQTEERFGRIRTLRWGPRTLDLDLLAYGDEEIVWPWLFVPHPRLHERLFVLVPLVEIAPRWVHPRIGLSALELLNGFPESCRDQTVRLSEQE